MVEERWLDRLQAACEAGLYRTESEPEQQMRFPWQDKHCRECPFWMNDVCQVDLRACTAEDPPCAFYDPPNFVLGRAAIEERLRAAWRGRWHEEYRWKGA
jgi:hypothetical protein